MFSRYGLLIVALGLIGFAALGQAQEQQTETDQSSTQEERQTESPPFGIPVVIVESEEAASAREAREEESRQREIDDLAAQEGMNAGTEAIRIATEDMRDYSLVQTAAIIIGTVALIWTLFETRKASRAAMIAAGASEDAVTEARRTVQVTRDIGEAQVRAYLTCDVAGGTLKANEPLLFQLRVANVGSSPALEVAVSCTLVLRDSNWWWDVENKDEVIPGERPKHVISPNQPYNVSLGTVPPEAITEADEAAIRAGTKTVFGSVTAYYNDIFGKPHTAHFAFEFSGESCFRTATVRWSRKGNTQD